MDIAAVHEFLVLAECGSFTDAAAKLYITQSSLSRHIQALENEFGFPLFIRSTKSVQLSEYGVLFMPYAQDIWSRYEAFCRAAKERDEQRHSKLDVLMTYAVGKVLGDFAAANEQYTVNLITGRYSDAEIAELLNAGKFELAFTPLQPHIAINFESKLVRFDRMFAIMPLDHPLAVREEIALSELRDERFCLLSEGQFEAKYVQEQCLKAGFLPKVAMRSGNGSYLVELVKKGVGITILFSDNIKTLPGAGLAQVPISGPDRIERRVYYRKNHKLSPAARELLKLLATKKNF